MARSSVRRRRSTASSAIQSIPAACVHLSRLRKRSATGKARRAPFRERCQTFFVVLRVVEGRSQRVNGATRIVKRRTVTRLHLQGTLHRPHGQRRVSRDRGRKLGGTPENRLGWREPVDQPQPKCFLRR